VVELTKQCILDTLGVMIGASGLDPAARTVFDLVAEMGGAAESSILGFGGKAPAPWAAFVNGSLGHMLDYDDAGGGHPGIATVPVAFATAEKRGGVSGRDLITAVAVGYDIMARLDQAVPIPEWTMVEGWFATQLFGFIAGAATAGRLLGLDADRMENALGIAYNQLCGSRQMAVGEASHCRSLQAGFTGQGAILAVALAQRGITGPKEILEGRYGLFRNYVRAERPDWDAVVGGLGARFPALERHAFKVWPACAATRPINAAILQLRQEYGLRPDDVQAITIIGGDGMTRFLCEPIAHKRRPAVSIDAKYSIPFTAAVAMQHGAVTLRAFTAEGLRDPAVLAMAQRVRYQPIAEERQTTRVPTVAITMRHGATLTRQVDGVPGDARHPASRAQLLSKFRDCVSFAARPIPPAHVDRAIALIADLEQVADATEVMRLLAGGAWDGE
jgi:2-methylcitrate dehydratase PrpD